MNTSDFLRAVLPSTGLYVIARLVNKHWKHQTCDSVEEAAAYALNFDAQGAPTYHACASYREHSVTATMKDGAVIQRVRTHENVKALRCFFMDLDVDSTDPKKFASQEAALEGLVEFIGATRLPVPMIVSSGYGIHCYWTLTHDIQPETWKQTAVSLKALCAALGFKADPACTSDQARVLRPVGTWNRKNPASPRPVECISDAPPVEYATLASTITAALRLHGVKPPDVMRPVVSAQENINQAFAVTHTFPPCSALKVADRCAQMGVMRDTRGVVTEPHWYAGLQLICSSIEGDELAHQWSSGHPGYSVESTDRKITQIRNLQLGPTLCSTFSDRNPGGCDGCPFAGKISSPAQLGTHIASAPAPVVEVKINEVITQVTLPSPPLPFTRGIGAKDGEGGIYIEEEGITHKIYEYDMYPLEVAFDEQLGYETTRWRHYLPQEGWGEIITRSALLARPVDFESVLRDHHIQPLIRNKMAQFGDAYLRKLRTDTKMRRLFRSQGWKQDEQEFVLGDRLYRKGEIIQAGFSQAATSFLAPFRGKGSLTPWRTLTSVFDHPGFEPHAFMLLLAFAAPLLKLAGREGFTVNALGTSGAGKSTMARFMSSVYNHPKDAWITKEDTALARVQRMGAHANVPVYMDEATTIPDKELRELVYMMPTGKSKASMRQDYTVRPGVDWSTILVASANESLQGKLQMEKANAEAESLRLFEFQFPVVADFGPIAKMIPAIVNENYGVAGAKYIEHLVNNRDAIRARLLDTGPGGVMQALQDDFGMEDKERFWSQAAALTLYGGQLALEAGVIEFQPERIRAWLKGETVRMRKTLTESYVGAVAILAGFLNEHVGERLVVTNINAGMTAVNQRVYHEISQRFEKDTMTLWIAKKRIMTYMGKGHFDYAQTRDELMQRGILESDRAMKVLGAGTDYAGGPSPSWRINAAHPELGALLEGEA